MTVSSSPTSHLVAALARLARKHPVERKLVVAPTFGTGRELLRRLSLAGKGWIGFEVTTPRPAALRVARGAMNQAGLRILDAFEQQALIDEAMDAALAGEGGGLGDVAEGVGFRERVQGAVTALRLAGIEPRRLDQARFSDWRKRLFLLRVLQGYERMLHQRRRADTATVLRLALSELEAGGSTMPAALGAEVVALVPGLGTRGLSGRFLAELGARGASVLRTDPVVGLDLPPSVLWHRRDGGSARAYLHSPGALPDDLPAPESRFFRAASVTDELREVLRRCIREGLKWDEVEIVTPDPETYGSALHALSTALGIPVTYAVGLPIERTRPGRVIRSYLDWIEEGFQADPIRRLLEAGDLRPPRTEIYHSGAELARRFRGLRVGWGRKRYRTQIRDALAALDAATPTDWESPEDFEKRVTRARSELKALRSILFPTLKATPAVPDRMGEGGGAVSPAELARGLRAFLRRVPKGKGPDRSARDEVNRVLERIEMTLRRRTDFSAAVTILRRHLQLRVRAPEPGAGEEDQGAPWGSEGGHLHISDLEHGGYAGRRATFIVGADAERLPGPGVQDPVLLDSDRRVLGDDLPTSSELLRERVFAFAALFSRLRGVVTMSYSAWDAAAAREVGPSPALLHALRLSRRDPELTFRDLHETLGRVVCRVPREGDELLDPDDVWMTALGAGDVMRRGVDLVRSHFPRLDAGLTAREARAAGAPGPIHGIVTARAAELDPRRNASLVVSASRLEALGSCPLRYLHASVLRLRAPDDPELDPDRWLDELCRGSLLHSVFEVTLREARARRMKAEEAAFEALALETLAAEIGRLEREVPSPGRGAIRREVARLEEDVRSFVRMVRTEGAPWLELELKFGLAGGDPLLLDVDGGQLRLRGAIDRVDENLEGMHVVDYKTGKPRHFEEGAGAFRGGRRLQLALYSHAAERLLGGTVVAGEYHFPTRRGENSAFRFDQTRLAGVGELLGHMLDTVAEGAFVPTDQKSDCAYCDYATICRVGSGRGFDVDSPLAEWSAAQLEAGDAPAFEALRRMRGFEE
jgi:RecB family exonuclease